MTERGVDSAGWPRTDRSDWCLFLDRDGVINRRIVDGYVRSWSEFEFLPGALDAVRRLSGWAPRLVVVTNQQGVGKGLMTTDELAAIHGRMVREAGAVGGRIDAVLTCEHLATDSCSCRKPLAGMVTRWLEDHPDVDPRRSVVVGDASTDMEMGRALDAAKCVWIGPSGTHDQSADVAFATLGDFASFVEAELLLEEAL